MSKLSIVEFNEKPTVNILNELRKIVSFDAELQRQILTNFMDSNGEILDSRLFTIQKIIIEAAKMLKELDPDIKRQELEMNAKAELALEIFRKRIKKEEAWKTKSIYTE